MVKEDYTNKQSMDILDAGVSAGLIKKGKTEVSPF